MSPFRFWIFVLALSGGWALGLSVVAAPPAGTVRTVATEEVASIPVDAPAPAPEEGGLLENIARENAIIGELIEKQISNAIRDARLAWATIPRV